MESTCRAIYWVHIRIKDEVGAIKLVQAPHPFQSSTSLVGIFLLCMFHFYLCYAVLSVYCSHVVTCWERVDLLALLCAVFSLLYFCNFPYGVPGQVWYLIVSIPDNCLPLYVLHITCAIIY